MEEKGWKCSRNQATSCVCAAQLISWVVALGLHGRVLVVEVAARVGFVRGFWKLLLCPVEPAGSKVHLLLARAEPISDRGSTYGVP